MELAGWGRETSPYHRGEQELQSRLGRKDRQETVAKKIHRPYMPDQHREFFAHLPSFIAGSVDKDGWPWASILFGEPGFVATQSDRRLSIGGGRISQDPFWENVKLDAPVGFLGMEMPTRRRNRVNGVVQDVGDLLEVDVVQSYGNCPQYIHTRDTAFHRDPQMTFDAELQQFEKLPPEVAELINSSDTLFVASHNPTDDKYDTGGVDVSHRGGRPGFVKVDGNTLTVPDYIGNFAFNTLGNFVVNPKAGLLFIDFNNGDLIQLVGNVELIWTPDEYIEAFRGAERAWRFKLEKGHVLKAASPVVWEARDPSPNSLMTGNWSEAAETLQIKSDMAAWRPFKVQRIEHESSVIRSIYLEPNDGKVLLPFKPGQFLTLKVDLKGREKPAIRTYTLSSAPSDAVYRISVKREGEVSSHLHDTISVGDIIPTRAPKGAFWLDVNEKRPAALLAGGVGITPMISMARQALSNGLTHRYHRNITVLHSVQTTEQRAFFSEFLSLKSERGQQLNYISIVEKSAEKEVAGRHFHAVGRIDQDLLQSVLPNADYDFYLCGPPAFMQALYDILINLGVRDTRIFAESFGPASLKRTSESNADSDHVDMAKEATVVFSSSNKEEIWRASDGTILEFAELKGLSPAFSCRSGNCGSCAVKLISGEVRYTSSPSFKPEKGEVLLCCSTPAKSKDRLLLDM